MGSAGHRSDLSLSARGVIRVLERIIACRGYAAKLRTDNGREIISIALADWAQEHGILLELIKPGTPTQNSCVERSNRTYRDEILNIYVFRNLSEVWQRTES